MILQQHYLGCLAQASYLIGEEGSKTAVIVDPRRDVDLYLDEAAKLGLTIRYVILTHFHADFLAGHLELAERTGAEILLGKQAEAEFPFRPVGDGDELVFGSVRLAFLETPGHTPEGISILVYDLEQSAEAPHGVLTGDTLFVGAVGRPDLMASVGVTADELARMHYRTLREKLMTLPPETVLYPGHGPGSACGKGMSSETTSTIGAQLATNDALQPMDEDAFVTLMTEGLPLAPAYFGYDAQLNRSQRRTLEDVLSETLKPLSWSDAARAIDDGAILLDTRSADAFASGHVPGAVHIGLGGQYASWAGTLLTPATPIVLLCDPQKEREAATRLGRIGFDAVVGYVEGGMASVPEDRRSERRYEPDELAAALASSASAPLVLDVRRPPEWENGHIDGALHVPLSQLEERLQEIPRDRELVCVCKGGYRSSIAKSLLLRHGFARLADMRGGMDAWPATPASGSTGSA